MRARLTRGRKWLIAVCCGGGLFVLDGCDPNVREEVLTGVGSAAVQLSTTFINAFFQSLINESQEEAAVVQALPDLPQLFC